MKDSNHEKLKAYFQNEEGIRLIDDTQAQHCGIHYFNFKATEDGLKKVLKRALKANCRVGVFLDGWNEVQYRIHVGCDNMSTQIFLET